MLIDKQGKGWERPHLILRAEGNSTTERAFKLRTTIRSTFRLFTLPLRSHGISEIAKIASFEMEWDEIARQFWASPSVCILSNTAWYFWSMVRSQAGRRAAYYRWQSQLYSRYSCSGICFWIFKRPLGLNFETLSSRWGIDLTDMMHTQVLRRSPEVTK